MTPTFSQLTAALSKAWSAETSCWGDDWPPDNPARGQCVTSSLVVQDYYGGNLIRFAVRGEGISENHYCNLLDDGTLFDTTRSQYKVRVIMQIHPVNLNGYSSLREKRLDDEETRMRYEVLKRRVATILSA
ncbi:MAG TPA: hypothetical protein VJ836_01580 [Candidatus Saccharimonadales bacterium]|nr:hypothetical protein [Candidatus Saccharimonadales bacterium]